MFHEPPQDQVFAPSAGAPLRLHPAALSAALELPAQPFARINDAARALALTEPVSAQPALAPASAPTPVGRVIYGRTPGVGAAGAATSAEATGTAVFASDSAAVRPPATQTFADPPPEIARPDFTQQRMRQRFSSDDRRGAGRPMRRISLIGGGPAGTIA